MLFCIQSKDQSYFDAMFKLYLIEQKQCDENIRVYKYLFKCWHSSPTCCGSVVEYQPITKRPLVLFLVKTHAHGCGLDPQQKRQPINVDRCQCFSLLVISLSLCILLSLKTFFNVGISQDSARTPFISQYVHSMCFHPLDPTAICTWLSVKQTSLSRRDVRFPS